MLYYLFTWNSRNVDFAYVRKVLAESILYYFLTWNSKHVGFAYVRKVLAESFGNKSILAYVHKVWAEPVIY